MGNKEPTGGAKQASAARGPVVANLKQNQVRQLEIDEANAGQRLDNFLRTQLKGVPKTRIYRIIRKGEVRVNKGRTKPEYKLRSGDRVRIPPIRVSENDAIPAISPGFANTIEKAILYEDDRLLVINKPSGLAVHGGSGISFGLIEALRKIRPEQRMLELVHRLDRETSGCVMVAKKRSMLRFLHEQLRGDGVQKYYKALVVGRWPKRKQRVNVPLQKNVLKSGERMVHVDDEGKRSQTDYRVCQSFPGYTLVEAKPVTGRTHQIRVHCRYAGYPIAGDDKYGEDEANRRARQLGIKRLFLHAERLEIPLPDSREILAVTAPFDDEMTQVLSNLAHEN